MDWDPEASEKVSRDQQQNLRTSSPTVSLNSQPLFGSCGNEPKSVWEFRLPHSLINMRQMSLVSSGFQGMSFGAVYIFNFDYFSVFLSFHLLYFLIIVAVRLQCTAIGGFRVAFRLCFKASPSAKPLLWKLVLFTCK